MDGFWWLLFNWLMGMFRWWRWRLGLFDWSNSWRCFCMDLPFRLMLLFMLMRLVDYFFACCWWGWWVVQIFLWGQDSFWSSFRYILIRRETCIFFLSFFGMWWWRNISPTVIVLFFFRENSFFSFRLLRSRMMMFLSFLFNPFSSHNRQHNIPMRNTTLIFLKFFIRIVISTLGWDNNE